MSTCPRTNPKTIFFACWISRLNVQKRTEKTQKSHLISMVWNNSRSLSSIIAGQVHKQKYKHTRQIVWSQNWLWWPWTEVDVTRRKEEEFFTFLCLTHEKVGFSLLFPSVVISTVHICFRKLYDSLEPWGSITLFCCPTQKGRMLWNLLNVTFHLLSIVTWFYSLRSYGPINRKDTSYQFMSAPGSLPEWRPSKNRITGSPLMSVQVSWETHKQVKFTRCP